MDYSNKICQLIYSTKITTLSLEEIQKMLEIPPKSELGDYAFPCFRFAKLFKKSPQQIAQSIANEIETNDWLQEVKVIGGYCNFFIDNQIKAQEIMEQVIKEREDFGNSNYGRGKNVVIEFSSPNIAKPFHIGHIRTTLIGNALYKIYRKLGYDPVAVNHLGDYGTQFGKQIVAIKKWGDLEVIKKNPIQELLKLYIQFHEEAEKHPELEDQAREWFFKLEKNDPEAVELWEFIREVSLEEFGRVYELLNVHFDSFAGESFYSDKMPEVVDMLKEKNLLKDSEGAKIVDLEPHGLPPALILKRDGSTIYITRDIAAAIYRKRHYDFEKNIYVVASQQALHFQQLFKILELMEFEWAKDCEHIQFGMVGLEDGTISTRQGRVVFLEEVLQKAIIKTKEVIQEKNPNIEDIDRLAEQIGVGAVIFQELSNSRIKDYTFSLDRTLSFEGETGPYVQYTHARACSLLRKYEGQVDGEIDYQKISDNEEAMEIIRVLRTYPNVLMRSLERNEPHHVARYLLDLCQAFNTFYHNHPVLTQDERTQKAYIALTTSVIIAIRNGLDLFGMSAPNMM